MQSYRHRTVNAPSCGAQTRAHRMVSDPLGGAAGYSTWKTHGMPCLAGVSFKWMAGSKVRSLDSRWDPDGRRDACQISTRSNPALGPRRGMCRSWVPREGVSPVCCWPSTPQEHGARSTTPRGQGRARLPGPLNVCEAQSAETPGTCWTVCS